MRTIGGRNVGCNLLLLIGFSFVVGFFLVFPDTHVALLSSLVFKSSSDLRLVIGKSFINCLFVSLNDFDVGRTGYSALGFLSCIWSFLRSSF